MVPAYCCVMWRRLSWVVRTTTSSRRINGQPASGLGIKLATGANALDTAAAIRAELAKMEPFFPSGLNRLPVRHHAVRENLYSRSG